MFLNFSFFLNILLQGHKDLAALELIFDFKQDLGEVAVVGWPQMLASLKTLLRPFLARGQDITAKLKRLWAYEVDEREGGDTRSVLIFPFFLLNVLTLLRSLVDNTTRDAKRARGLEALPGDPDFLEGVRATTVCVYSHHDHHHHHLYHPLYPRSDAETTWNITICALRPWDGRATAPKTRSSRR